MADKHAEPSPDKNELENLKDNSSSEGEGKQHGGAREGAGRPKGSMNEHTKYRREVKAKFQKRVADNAERLFNAQFNLATGEQYLMCKRKVGKGASARTITEVVDSPEIIKQYIDGSLDESEDEWYFISTKPANGMAIDSMLNRVFGKPEEKLDITSNDETIGSALSAEQLDQLIRARAGRSDT